MVFFKHNTHITNGNAQKHLVTRSYIQVNSVKLSGSCCNVNKMREYSVKNENSPEITTPTKLNVKEVYLVV